MEATHFPSIPNKGPFIATGGALLQDSAQGSGGLAAGAVACRRIQHPQESILVAGGGGASEESQALQGNVADLSVQEQETDEGDEEGEKTRRIRSESERPKKRWKRKRFYNEHGQSWCAIM